MNINTLQIKSDLQHLEIYPVNSVLKIRKMTLTNYQYSNEKALLNKRNQAYFDHIFYSTMGMSLNDRFNPNQWLHLQTTKVSN